MCFFSAKSLQTSHCYEIDRMGRNTLQHGKPITVLPLELFPEEY